MMRMRNSNEERGFTLWELLVVVTISLVVAAVAIPNMWNSVQDYRLRAAASDVSGLIQKDRMLSVSQNKYYAVRNYASGNNTFAYVDLNNNGSYDAASEAANNLQIPRSMAFDSSGSAPSTTSMNLGFTTVTALPEFTPRGLPCVVSSGVCTANGQGYIAYLRQDRSLGGTGWAAVTVSPAGRVRVWVWNGNAWQ